MDILEQYWGRREILPFIRLLTFKKNKVELKGTASLKSQQFFSDYDLYSLITEPPTEKQAYNEIARILADVEQNPDIYFIELKLQQRNGEKTKFNTIAEITPEAFKEAYKNIEFIKMDFVIYIDGRFIELSIIYDIDPTEKDYKKSLMNDIKELLKEGNYYKVLKRYFAMYKGEPINRPKLLELSELFNSETGEAYQKLGNLQAIMTLLDHYDDDLTINRVKNNLKNMGMRPKIDLIENEIKTLTDEVNSEAYKYLKKKI
jgi:hypothetical protein